MANVGPVAFFSLVGAISGPGPQLLDITSPGVPGSSFAVIQWRGEECRVRGLRLCNVLADVWTSRALIEGLRGGVWTITDDWGDTRPFVLVREAREAQVQEVATSTAGIYAYMWWDLMLEELY